MPDAVDIETMRLASVTANDPNADVPPGMYGKAGDVIATPLCDKRVFVAIARPAASVVLSAETAERLVTALLGATGHPVTQIGKAPR